MGTGREEDGAWGEEEARVEGDGEERKGEG